jgi:hypothetical protein
MARKSRMWRFSWHAVLLAVVAVPLFGLGCGSRPLSAPPRQTEAASTRAASHERLITLTNSDGGRSVAVAVGGEIDVTLQTVGPGQYGTPILSSKCVRFLGVSLAGPPNPGGPRQLFRFKATAMGRAKISIAHEGGAPGGPTTPSFNITVGVH